jgi:8-amino-7-oxononanoate synthase
MSVNNVLAIVSAWDVLESDEGDRVRLQIVDGPFESRTLMSMFAFIQRRRDLQRICNVFNHEVSQLLRENIVPDTLLSLLADKHATTPTEPTHITPLITPHPHSLALHLRESGFLTRPVVHPTVPKGRERVRVCLHAGNREEDVLGLVAAIREWIYHGSHTVAMLPLKARL